MTTLTRNDPLVFHFRLGKGTETQPKAGATVVFLLDQKRFGITLCCAKDRYDRKRGARIAILRAENVVSGHSAGRFPLSRSYDGPMKMDAIRLIATRMVIDAATRVQNPVITSLIRLARQE